MKKTAIIAVALMLGAFNGFAQEGKTTDKKQRPEMSFEEKVDKKTQKMTETLGLDEKQAAKIREINAEHIKTMDELHLEMKAIKTKVKEERSATKLKIEKELTAEQKEIMRQKEEEHKKKRAEKKKDCCHK